MKLWTWGYRQGSSANPLTFGDSRRPYIELWAGHSREFFTDARLDANAEKKWDEYYIPTVGLPGVSYANQHALIDLDYSRGKAPQDHAFTARVFATHPGETMDLWLRLRGAKDVELYHGECRGNPAKAVEVEIAREAGGLGPGQYRFELLLSSASGEKLAEAGIPIEIR